MIQFCSLITELIIAMKNISVVNLDSVGKAQINDY